MEQLTLTLPVIEIKDRHRVLDEIERHEAGVYFVNNQHEFYIAEVCIDGSVCHTLLPPAAAIQFIKEELQKELDRTFAKESESLFSNVITRIEALKSLILDVHSDASNIKNGMVCLNEVMSKIEESLLANEESSTNTHGGYVSEAALVEIIKTVKK